MGPHVCSMAAGASGLGKAICALSYPGPRHYRRGMEHSLDVALRAACKEPPAARLEVIWSAFEHDTGTAIGRPPTVDERHEVSDWLRGLRSHDDYPMFTVAERALRVLAARTPGEKAGNVVQSRCRACELIVLPDGSIPMALHAPINVDPISAQSHRGRARWVAAVRDAMQKRRYTAPNEEDDICLTVVSFVPVGARQGRKDVDNLVKGLLDALQGVLYKNDFQVQCLTTRRVTTRAVSGAYLVDARAVHPWTADVVYDDGKPLNILSDRIGVD